MDSKAEKGLNLGAAFFNLYTVSQNSYFVHMYRLCFFPLFIHLSNW